MTRGVYECTHAEYIVSMTNCQSDKPSEGKPESYQKFCSDNIEFAHRAALNNSQLDNKWVFGCYGLPNDLPKILSPNSVLPYTLLQHASLLIFIFFHSLIHFYAIFIEQQSREKRWLQVMFLFIPLFAILGQCLCLFAISLLWRPKAHVIFKTRVILKLSSVRQG